MSKDYYKILGVEKSATSDEIKKAFRKKAHEFHPDKSSGDESKFKEVNEAYQVLGNEKKRAQYDQFGSSAFSGDSSGASGGMNWEDVMRQSGFGGASGGGFSADFGDLGDIFSDMFGFGGSRNSSGRRESGRVGEDIQIGLSLEFLEAVFGVTKKINLERYIKCKNCQGNGAEPGTKIKECERCAGNGEITQSRSSILGTIQTRVVCPDCSGEGKVNEKNCADCHGQGRQLTKEAVDIKIPAGIDNGQTVRMSGLGSVGRSGAEAGDLYISVNVKNSKKWRRENYNILTFAKISIAQAVLGDKIGIETVHGAVELKIPQGTESGKVFKLSSKGVPKLQSSGNGDHLVEVAIEIPNKLSKKQKQLFEELKNLDKDKSGWFGI